LRRGAGRWHGAGGAGPPAPTLRGLAAAGPAPAAASVRPCPHRLSARHESAKRGIFETMHARKIRVQDGRIKLDEPTDLPNGTELVVVPVDELEDVVLMQDDGLDDEERQELLRSIDEGLADVDAGNVHDFKEVVASLGTRT
jgi:hypothetical protein